MGRYLQRIVFAFAAVCLGSTLAYAQPDCLGISTGGVTNVTCFGGANGTITINITPGDVSQNKGQPPYRVELYFQDSGGGLTQLANLSNITASSVTFGQGNGTLNEPGAEAFGIPANDLIDPGSSYRVVVNAAIGSAGVLSCNRKQLFGITVSQPTDPLDASVSSITPACTPGSGAISLDVSGGTGAYTYAWTGPPPAIGSVQDPTGLNAGTYSVTITDDNSCTFELTNIVVPPPPDATINPAGPFCQTAAPVTLTAATAGGMWSGTGITDASAGTFNPAVAGPGLHSITYSIGGPCPASNSIDITVQAAPDATITAAGPFCQTASPVTLTAATPGGTWSGPGVNPSTGSFDPAAASVGNNNITYTITVGLCTSSDTKVIVVEAPPNAAINPAGPFCANDEPTTLTAATTGGTWSGPGITDGATGDFDPSMAAIGNNSITYTLTVGICTVVSNRTIVVQAPPNATITAAGPFCQNGSAVTLTAATSGGTWSGPGVNPATGSFNPATATIGNNQIIYSVTVGLCSQSDTTNIVVEAAPDAAINDAGPFCSTDLPVTLSAATTGGTWSGPGITDAATGEFSPTAATIGNNTVIYTVAVGACTVTDAKVIVVQAPPTAAITSIGALCETGSPVTLTATPAGGMWSGPGITDPAAGIFEPALAGPGSHGVTYSVTVGACMGTDTENIQVNSTPTAGISGSTSICEGQPAALSINFTGTAPWSIEYTDGSSNFNVTTSVNPFTLNVSPASTTTYSLVSVSGAGCSGTASGSATVTVDTPVLTLPPTTICENGGSVDLTTIVSANPAGGTFTFTGTGVTGNMFDPTGLSGTVSIQVDYTEACAAPTGTLDLTITDAAAINVPPSAVQVCQGAGIIDLNDYVSGTPGDYVFSGNPAITGDSFDPSGLSGVQNIIVDYVGSCTAPQVSFDIDVITTLPPLTMMATSICANVAPIDLTTRVSSSMGGGTFTFTGTGVTGDMFDPAGFTGPTTVTINVMYTLPGCGSIPGTLPIDIRDPATCLPNCFVFTIDIDPLTHRPSCNGGQDGVIALTVTGPTTNLLVTVYRDGDPMPVPTPGLSGGLFEFTDLKEGSYHYRLEASNGVFCVQDFVWEAVENVQATASAFQDSPCFGTPSGSAVLDATGSSTGQYFYSVNATDWTEFVPGNVVTGLPGDGTYNIRIGGSVNDPCYDVVSVTINQLGTALLDTVYVSPVSGFPAVSFPETPTATRVIGIEESGAAPYEVRLELVDPYGITPNPPFIIDWRLVDELNQQSFIPQEQIDGLYSGEYRLSLRDAAGCEKTFSFIIGLDDRIFIPNIFTPNKTDNINKNFFIRNLPVSGSRLSVTDRWGKEVYASNNYNPDTLWDGGEAPDGVYFYRLQIKGGKTYTGWVEILRGSKP